MEPERMREAEPLLTEAERRARERVRRLPRASADPEFRARLAADFTLGELERLRRVSAIRLPWHRREMTRWALGAAVAAALVVVTLALNQGPPWRVVSLHGRGIATVDGREVALRDVPELERRMKPGAQIVLPTDADMMLRAGDEMMLALDPGAVVTLPGTPGRWFGRRAEGRVDVGTMRVSTGPTFHGAALAISTPEARLRVIGTTFAVICEPTGTCVCVLEGVVDVGPLGGPMSEIASGMRGYVYASGAPMDHEGMRPDERVKLALLRAKRIASAGDAR